MKTKRFLGILITLTMIIGLLPIMTSAQDIVYTGDIASESLLLAEEDISASARKGKVLYFTPNKNWLQGIARFAAYFFGEGEVWVDMTAVEGEMNIYKFTIPQGNWSGMILLRMNPNDSANNWNNKWNQTKDLLIPTDGTNHYIYAESYWDSGRGTWTTYYACGGNHIDEDENHLCDVCNQIVSECDFDTNNGFCLACGGYEEPELKDNHYQIENAGQLYWFANHINTVDRTANAVLINDIDLEGKPDGTGRKWTPIGSTGENSNNFRGHFNGNNHTITNLYVDKQGAGIGLFGEVRLGTVENFTIYGDVKLYGDCSYVGGVIGSAPGANGTDVPDHNGATIRNITSYVNVTLVENAHGSSYVGGFIGYANHETIIENCSWYGTLDLGAYRADSGVGGLVGRLYDGSDVTIRNCGAYGTIKTSYKSGTHNNYDTIYIGGVLSYSPAGTQSVLENNLWAGKFIDGTDLGEKAHLSAFGTLNGEESVTNCYTIDSVPYITTEDKYTGGITIVTAQQLASGEVAYKLGEFWGQTIGTDDYPVLGGMKVYSNGETYNNRVLGDVDGDMLVTSEDSVILSRYFAKWTGYSDTEYDVSSCDLDLNGIVDSNDNVILARHLANWFGYLTIPVTNEN